MSNNTSPSHIEDVDPRPTPQRGDLRILVVDPEPQVHTLLRRAVSGRQVKVITAASVGDARKLLTKGGVDLALIDPNLPDGSGIELAKEIKDRRAITQTILMSGEPSMERAIEAMRAGAADFMIKPLDLADLNERVGKAIDRHRKDRKQAGRVSKLRRICKKLNVAHDEVAQQVDILCNDLVTAYQELAAQMQEVVQTSEYSSLLKQELDLERLLRKTLEFLLEKVGPTNAAIFLPSSADEYTLGGYVNMDCSRESADLLLDHLADSLAPAVADGKEPVHLTDAQSVGYWIGDHATFLRDSHVLAFPCRHDDETLAVVALFRRDLAPFDAEVAANSVAIGPLLGEYLAKVIRVHHRHAPIMDDGYDSQNY